jgi:hypothetical protein
VDANRRQTEENASGPATVAWLIRLGLVTEIIYLGAFLLPYPLLGHYRTDTDMAGIAGHSGGGFSLFVAAFLVLFGLATAAFALVARDCDSADHSRVLKVILGFGALFALTLVFVYPVTATDVFNYVAESRVLVHYHQNPIFVAPSRYPADPIMQLPGYWAGSGSPYGPFGIIASAWPALVVGGNLLWNLILLKATYGLLVVAEGMIVYRLLSRVEPRRALAGAILVAWSPLLLFECAVNGHNDILMLVMVSLGLLALVEGRGAVGVLLVGASALVKYATLPLLPLALIYLLSRDRPWLLRIRDAAIGLISSLVLLVVAYAPFWQGTDTLTRTLEENQLHLQSFSSALTTLFPAMNIDTATWTGRVIWLPLYVVAAVLATRDSRSFLSGCCLTMMGFLALAAANVKIWYLSWPMALAGPAGRSLQLTALLMSLGATLSAAIFAYVFLWEGGSGQDFAWTNLAAYLMAFGPVLILPVLLAVGRDGPPPLSSGEIQPQASRT